MARLLGAKPDASAITFCPNCQLPIDKMSKELSTIPDPELLAIRIYKHIEPVERDRNRK